MKTVKISKNFVERNAPRRKKLKATASGKYVLRIEARFAKRLEVIFDKQKLFVLEAIKPMFSVVSKNQVDQDTVDELVSEIPYFEDISDEVIRFAGLSLIKGVKHKAHNLKLRSFGANFDLKNKEAIKFLEQRRSLELSDRKGSIGRTTKRRIKSTLLKALNDGLTYDQVAQKITKFGEAGVFSKARAKLIAIRELGVAFEQGKDLSIREYQYQNPGTKFIKKWLTVGDDKVTVECLTNGKMDWLPYRSLFPSGDRLAPRHDNPQCRCTTREKRVKKIKFQRQKSIKDLNTWARKKKILKNGSFNGMDLDFANDTAEELTRIQNETGLVFDSVKVRSFAKEKENAVMKFSVGIEKFVEKKPGKRFVHKMLTNAKLSINKNVFADKKSFEKRIKDNYEHGFSAVRNVQGVVAHEFGHFLTVKTGTIKQYNDKLKQIRAEKVAAISKYGATDQVENLAEIYGAYATKSKPVSAAQIEFFNKYSMYPIDENHQPKKINNTKSEDVTEHEPSFGEIEILDGEESLTIY